ncbi:transcriptional regulator, TetR family [Enterococcus faecalis 13-SD-W-01]|nr:transcriptional regulator, TetR family [Enterococcus faecalis 13-SD-W-01]
MRKMKKRNLSADKIVECLRELSKELPPQQITFQHLAKQLDIKSPSLYNYFKNIQEVRNALTVKLLQELNDQLRRRLVGLSGAEAIRSYADTYQTFAFENQPIYELMINIPQTGDERSIDAIHETNQIILQILGAFPLTEQEKIHRSRELRSLIHGYVSLRFLGYFTKETQVDSEESYHWMIDHFIETLPEIEG